MNVQSSAEHAFGEPIEITLGERTFKLDLIRAQDIIDYSAKKHNEARAVVLEHLDKISEDPEVRYKFLILSNSGNSADLLEGDTRIEDVGWLVNRCYERMGGKEPLTRSLTPKELGTVFKALAASSGLLSVNPFKKAEIPAVQTGESSSPTSTTSTPE